MRSFECRRVNDVVFGPGGTLYVEISSLSAAPGLTKWVAAVPSDFAGRVNKQYPRLIRGVTRPYLVECDYGDPAGGQLSQLLVMFDQKSATFQRFDPHRFVRLDYPPLQHAPLDNRSQRKIHFDSMCRDFGRAGIVVTSGATTKVLTEEFGYVDEHSEFDFVFNRDEIWVASVSRFSHTGTGEWTPVPGCLVRLVTDGGIRGGGVHCLQHVLGADYRKTHDGFFYRFSPILGPFLYWQFGSSEPTECWLHRGNELLHCFGRRMMTTAGRRREVTISNLDGTGARTYDFADKGVVYGGRFSPDGLTAVFWTGLRVYQFDLE